MASDMNTQPHVLNHWHGLGTTKNRALLALMVSWLLQDASASDDEAAPPGSAAQLQPLDEAAALEAELDGQPKPSRAATGDSSPDETSDDEDGAQLSGEDDGDTSSDEDVEEEVEEAAADVAAAGVAAADAQPASRGGAGPHAHEAADAGRRGKALGRRSRSRDSAGKEEVGHHQRKCMQLDALDYRLPTSGRTSNAFLPSWGAASAMPL
jgi:hypothetical protein